MFKNFIAVALLATLFVSCKGKVAATFNDKLIAIQNSLVAPIEAGEASAVKFFEEGKYDSLYAVGNRMEKLVESKMAEVEAVKTPDLSEAENFKNSYIKAYKALKEIYSTYKRVGAANTDEERQTLVDGIDVLVKEKDAASDQMQAAQRKFASANGFKLQ